MHKYRLSQELGNVDEDFLEEVFEYKPKKTVGLQRAAAIAACAAIVLGLGTAAFSKGISTQPEEPVVITDKISIVDNMITYDIEHPYSSGNESDENDEDITTYFDLPIECDGYSYVLKYVSYSAEIPPYIDTENMIWRLGSEPDILDERLRESNPYQHVPGDGTEMYEHLDENGKYLGEKSRTWVFVTFEVTNLSDEACSADIFGHCISYERPGNSSYSIFSKVTVVPGEEFPPEVRDPRARDGMPGLMPNDVMIDFEPNETKTMIFGYLIYSDFIQSSVKVSVEQSDAPRKLKKIYLK